MRFSVPRRSWRPPPVARRPSVASSSAAAASTSGHAMTRWSIPRSIGAAYASGRDRAAAYDADVPETRILPGDDPAAIEAAAALLRSGEPVAFPTETVYGLGADALDAVAVARVFEIKGRPRFDPLIVHLPSPDSLEA